MIDDENPFFDEHAQIHPICSYCNERFVYDVVEDKVIDNLKCEKCIDDCNFKESLIDVLVEISKHLKDIRVEFNVT